MSELAGIGFVSLFCVFLFAATFTTSRLRRALYSVAAGFVVATLIRGLMS